MNVAEALIRHLEAHGVEVVFGIPGVHTVELYRGLAASGIRHVTPRHEQGAGFMADGYARVTGKPGVALVITGPGLTNTLTPMAQARADSIPILVLSGVNALPSLGRGEGRLHELPDQRALASQVAQPSIRIERPGDLGPAMERVFAGFTTERPVPAHIEIPLDMARQPYQEAIDSTTAPARPLPEPRDIARAAEWLKTAQKPVILAGGGARWHDETLAALAERIDAPTVLTINARGLLHNHPLAVPASPSLESVRRLIADADLVLAVGTEFGQTDYDIYATGRFPELSRLIRVDICADQLARVDADIAIRCECGSALELLTMELTETSRHEGPQRAAEVRRQVLQEIGPRLRDIVKLIETMRDTIPQAVIVGDSTDPVYAGDLFYSHDKPGGWFNAATGYGALGYAIPAAIGAAIGAPDTPILCLVGDGGAQFSLPELMVAKDERLPIIFIVWNNRGYREIASAMREAGVTVIGCDPTPPDFRLIAAACGTAYEHCQPVSSTARGSLAARSFGRRSGHSGDRCGRHIGAERICCLMS